MPTFNEIIEKAGKGKDDSKDFIYLADVNFGGTLGTFLYGNRTIDVEGTYYSGRLTKTGVGNVSRSIQPEKATYQVSDLSLTFANEKSEFSKFPYNKTLLNKKIKLRLGFPTLELSDYNTIFEGLVKKEQRKSRKFSISLGDNTHKIDVAIPPRIVGLTEFPNAGTVVEEDIIGKAIPFVYGNFANAPVIKPLYIDTVQNRYLVADHSIGTIVKVFSGGTQVFNFTFPKIIGTSGGGANPYPTVAGTHTGTNIMSFITFAETQGTKTVKVEIKGKLDTGGTVIENPASILRDFLTDGKINTGLTESDIGTSSFDIAKRQLVGVDFRHVMDGKLSKSIDFIKQLTRDTLANFFFSSSNKAKFKVFQPLLPSAIAKTFNASEIIQDSFNVTKIMTDLINRGVLSYNFDYHAQIYRNVFTHTGTTSVADLQTTTTDAFTSLFIYSAGDAEALVRRRIRRFENSINKISFSTIIRKLPIELADIIEVTHNEGVSSVGGWGTRAVEIVSVSIDNQKKEINLQCYDAEELNNKYFFLGDRTIQGTKYTTASDVDRKYGYLAGRDGGTFSNGDLGYRLW